MTTKAQLLKAIRKHCLECCGGLWTEVRDCTPVIMPSGERRCTLYPYRFGKDPAPAKRGMDNLKGSRYVRTKHGAKKESDVPPIEDKLDGN